MKKAEILQAMEKERQRQDKLHPIPEGQQLPNLLWYAILGEEVGEIGKALQDGIGLDAEIIQVAAVCMRWLENR